MESCVWAMLVAKPGPLRDSLRELVSAIPFTHAFVFENASAALDNLHECHPALVVVDFDPADSVTWQLMKVLSVQSPAIRHVFLVETVEEQRLVLSSGAKVALLKGFSAARLHRVIRGLLPKTEEERVLYQPEQIPNGVRVSEVAVAV